MAEIRTIALISAGVAGRSIARLASLSITSALSISEIASDTYRASKCAGIRLSDWSDPMTPLEIVRAGETDDDTVAAVSGVGGRMGCDITVTGDRVSTLPALTNA